MILEKVLIVEDNPAIRKALERILDRSGYETVSARDGKAALEILAYEIPDLIVSDIMMPNMDGYEFYKRLRKIPELNTVPVIFLTALNDEGDVRKGKELGVDDYITKPFKREDVLSVVKGKLKRRAELNKTAEEGVEELKKEIIMTLSHEFKTPLTIIQGFTSLLLRDDMGLDGVQLREFLNYIKVSGDRLDGIINDFIRMMEIETGLLQKEINLLLSQNDINLLLKNLTERYESENSGGGINFITEFAPHLPFFSFSVKHTSIALEKILDNAIKFSDKSKKERFIKVISLKKNDSVVIKIQDNGVGIADTEFTHIFEKFYQVERKKNEQPGCGLGLPIARSYIELNSGTLSLESEVGEGSIFTITFPGK